MKHALKNSWRHFLRLAEEFEKGSNYPYEEIRELQLEVAKLKAAGSERLVCPEGEQTPTSARGEPRTLREDAGQGG